MHTERRLDIIIDTLCMHLPCNCDAEILHKAAIGPKNSDDGRYGVVGIYTLDKNTLLMEELYRAERDDLDDMSLSCAKCNADWSSFNLLLSEPNCKYK